MSIYGKYIKSLLIGSSVLLVFSLVGVLLAFRQPDETVTQIPQISYEHTGSFDYLLYLKPSYLFGNEPQPPPPPLPNLKYPTEMIDHFKFNFTYSLTPQPQVTKITEQIEVNASRERRQRQRRYHSAAAKNEPGRSLFRPF